ncbi:MAG: DUF362 domain-containing protein [Thermodesulfobacteriota bacterium]
MDRRQFLQSSLAGAGLALAGDLGLSLAAPPPGASATFDLAVARGPVAARNVAAAVAAWGGMERFVSRGDVVVVKPNMAWDRTPEQAANTDPAVVAEVVRLCLAAGAKTVKVFDRPVNDPRRCYRQSGIERAAIGAGAQVKQMDDRRFREMAVKGETMANWPLYVEVFEADKVINVPIAKHHSLARMTGAMKNWMGIMGGNRSRIHQRLDESLCDLASFVRPTLTVLDATRVLLRNGPQGGDLGDVLAADTIVVGQDQVAVDAWASTLFGRTPDDLPVLAAARRRDLGKTELAAITIRELAVS